MNDDVRVLPTLHLDRSLKISTTALFNHFGVADADPAPGATDPMTLRLIGPPRS